MPPEMKRLALLSPAEREVWDRIQREAWRQMVELFPRLEAFSGVSCVRARVRKHRHRRKQEPAS